MLYCASLIDYLIGDYKMKMKQIKQFAFEFCIGGLQGEPLSNNETRLINYFVDFLQNENDLIKFRKASEPMPEPPAEINIIGL